MTKQRMNRGAVVVLGGDVEVVEVQRHTLSSS
jgi:hypothetical protein